MNDPNTSQRWNVPTSMLSEKAQGLKDYVLIGKQHDGRSTIVSSGDDTFARTLLKDSGFTSTKEFETSS